MATFGFNNLDSAYGSPGWSPVPDTMEPPKKKRTRARLDHMTPEEKQERRKEKNRQAAQTARDRKRSRLEKLEEENRRLREENMRLKGAILGNSRAQSVVDCCQPQPVIHVTDSGMGDVESKLSTSLTSSNVKDKNCNDIQMDRIGAGSCGRTTTPDSSYNYSTSIISPVPSDESYIDSIIEIDNDDVLVNGVRELVSYVNGDDGFDMPFGSAALINEPQQQVQGLSTGPCSIENSLGWTSIQLMLILMISRIHHRSSARINCCRRVPMKSNEPDELDPIYCNLYDYLLNTRCTNFRHAADRIISNKYNVRNQRLAALEFVKKYLCNENFTRHNHSCSPQVVGNLIKVQRLKS